MIGQTSWALQKLPLLNTQDKKSFEPLDGTRVHAQHSCDHWILVALGVTRARACPPKLNSSPQLSGDLKAKSLLLRRGEEWRLELALFFCAEWNLKASFQRTPKPPRPGWGRVWGKREVALLTVSSACPLVAATFTARLRKQLAATYKWTPRT